MIFQCLFEFYVMVYISFDLVNGLIEDVGHCSSELADHNKVLPANSAEYQYLKSAMECWASQGSEKAEKTEGVKPYRVLEDILEKDVRTHTYEQASHAKYIYR